MGEDAYLDSYWEDRFEIPDHERAYDHFGYRDAYQDGEDEDDYPDDSMDGDAESALTSCGWGTDESYGHFGGEEY